MARVILDILFLMMDSLLLMMKLLFLDDKFPFLDERAVYDVYTVSFGHALGGFLLL